MTPPLRIAVPKGRLQPHVLAAFAAAGFDVPDLAAAPRRLIFAAGGVEWVLVKDADVPLYVELGAASLGVAGRDQLIEAGSDVYQPVEFPFGRCRISLIATPGAPPLAAARVVATKYPNLTRRWLAARHAAARVVPLSGSVELAPLVGLAPYIVDLIESGATIREHGLREVEVLEPVAPLLIANKDAWRIDAPRIRRVVEAIELATPMEVPA